MLINKNRNNTGGILMFNFSISWLIFWMKGRVQVDNQSVRSRVPRLLLWVFPYGLIAKDANLDDITTTQVKSQTQIFPLFIGLVLIVLGALSTMHQGVAIGILAIVIGLILAIASFKVRLVIQTTNGSIKIDAFASQKNILLEIEKEIQDRKNRPEPQIKANQILEEL
jgi:hypothetical protein